MIFCLSALRLVDNLSPIHIANDFWDWQWRCSLLCSYIFNEGFHGSKNYDEAFDGYNETVGILDFLTGYFLRSAIK